MELKRHTYRRSFDSAELSSAVRCEKICADTSFCPCTRNSSAPFPDTSGIAHPADTDRCKRKEN